MLTGEAGFQAGWDFPPRFGAFGVVSQRTCGNCLINTTAWWQLAVLKKNYEELSDKHKSTVLRILGENK
jgi:hypothetical protein